VSFVNAQGLPLLGHQAAIQLLQGQLKQDRIPHALLLTGPEGIGKYTLAAAFAKQLVVENPKSIYPDLTEVAPESANGQIKIDQIRELTHWMTLTPLAGDSKVGIIDSVDQMGLEAANACLKFLEEPPNRSILILVSSAPHRMPDTLRSRCQQIQLKPQGIEAVRQYLEEKCDVESNQAQQLAVSSGGRLGLAIRYLEEEALDEKNADLDQILQALQSGALELPLSTATRPEMNAALDWLASYFRDQMVLAAGGDERLVIHQDRLAQLKKFQAPQMRTHLRTLIKRVEKTYRVQEAIQKNGSAKVAWSVLLSS